MSKIEYYYLVAVRQQLGLGLDGLMKTPGESETGEVCRACKKGTIVEPRRDQHIQAGCLTGQGSGAWRTTASSRSSPT